ncbi:MAG: hypothetical protein K2X44_09035 [Magnetospirillum sp.]|nr:hypothetical protein [Magnetospirillum sp.]
MSDITKEIIEELRACLPRLFHGPSLGDLTGGLFNWRTIQNRRAAGEIPDADNIFFKMGAKVGIRRDPFLAYAESKLALTRGAKAGWVGTKAAQP